ncbi:MAG: HlyD family secretion protein [Sulfurovum sp.]|nr:HlyD family secretion protein [Sulfurovum sp.]
MYRFEVLSKVNPRAFVKHTMRWTMLFIGVLLLMLFLPWQQTIKGVGTLTALDPTQRQYDILSPVDGVVETFYVQENSFVKQGEKLFAMHDLDRTYDQKINTIYKLDLQQIENYDRELQEIERQQKAQEKLYRTNIAIVKEKLKQTQSLIDAYKERQKALETQKEIEAKNYKRSQKLYQDGIESQRDMELKQYVLLKTEAEYAKIKAQLHNKQAELQILQKELKRTNENYAIVQSKLSAQHYQVQTKRDKIVQNSQKSALTRDRYAQRIIYAKDDGYLSRIYLNNGNRFVKKGEKILSFMPKVTQRAIRLKVSSFNMPLVQKGLKVRIMFYGWPSLYISGWPKISHGTYGGVVYSVEPSSSEDGIYYALVVEDPQDQPWPPYPKLKYGTQASLWVRLSTVPIWYELWRLLAAQPPKMLTYDLEEEALK